MGLRRQRSGIASTQPTGLIWRSRCYLIRARSAARLPRTPGTSFLFFVLLGMSMLPDPLYFESPTVNLH